MQRPIETNEPKPTKSTKINPPPTVATIPVQKASNESPTPRFALLDDGEPGIVRSID